MIDFLFNPNGRISRKGYLLGFFLPMIGITLVLPALFGPVGFAAVGAVGSLFFLWPSNVSVPVRRLHDLGLTGWYQAGFIGLFFLSAMVFATGMGPDNIAGTMAVLEGNGAALDTAADRSKANLGLGLLFATAVAQFILFAAVPGRPGGNQYGDDPLASGRGFAD